MPRSTREFIKWFPIRGYHPLWPTFPSCSSTISINYWPNPRSLATTNGVSVDVLSSGYLDVSVRRVCFVILCIQITMTLTGRVSPFGNPRIKDCSHLPVAYRNVLRPSSPLSAKAFTKCPSTLDYETVMYRDKPGTRCFRFQ